MATRKRRHGGSSCARNRRANVMYGGNLGNGFRLGAEMLTRGSAVIEPYGSCGALSRPGQLSTDVTNGLAKGLPGLSGGGRRRRQRQRKTRGRKQRGGRYEAVFSGAEFEALGPRGGMLATAGQLPCERGAGAYVSPTQSTMPARQAGGGAQLAPAPFLQEQTAGYTNTPSKWFDSVGAPVQLQVPIGGRMETPACKVTGGGRRKRGGAGEQIPAGEYNENNEKRNPLIEEGFAVPNVAAAAAAAAPVGPALNYAPAPEEGSALLNNGVSVPTEPEESNNKEEATDPTQEGGRRRRSKSRKQKRKASRKSRKASRKSRKASRKSRKASRN